MFPSETISIPARNPYSNSSTIPFGIDNPNYHYNINSKGDGKAFWPRFSEPVQSCTPEPKLTAMFNPRITVSYLYTNSAYREQILEQYDVTLFNMSDDHSKVNIDSISNESQPPVCQLAIVHLVNSNQQLALVPFTEAVALHSGVIPDHRGSLQSQSDLQLVLKSPEINKRTYEDLIFEI